MGPPCASLGRDALEITENSKAEASGSLNAAKGLEAFCEALEVAPTWRRRVQREGRCRVSHPGRDFERDRVEVSRAGALDEELGLALEVQAPGRQAARSVT